MICCNIENFNGRNISHCFKERKVVSYDSFPLDNFSSCQPLDFPTNSQDLFQVKMQKIPSYFNTAIVSQPGKSCSYVPVFKLAAYVMLCFHWVSCKYNNRMTMIVWHNHCRGTNHTLPKGSSKSSDLVFVPASWLNLVLPKGGKNFSKDNLQNSCTVICFYLFIELHEGITLLLVNKQNAVGMIAPLLRHCKEHQLCHSSEFFVVAPFHLPLISFPNDTMLLRLMSQTIKIVK